MKYAATIALQVVIILTAHLHAPTAMADRTSSGIDCPKVTVSCPSEARPGEPMTIVASVTGGDPNVTPTFNWSISAGTISSGQGTSSITVDTSGLGGQTITATVEVGGYPNCPTTRSCSVQILALPPPSGRLFDRYGSLRVRDEAPHLDNYTMALQNEPGSQSFIIGYAGPCDSPAEATRRADRAKRYLVTIRGIDSGRIITKNGGLHATLQVELWIVSQGGQSPELTPEALQCRPRGRR